MWPDRVSNPGPLTYESGAIPTALRGPAVIALNCRLSSTPLRLSLVSIVCIAKYVQILRSFTV